MAPLGPVTADPMAVQNILAGALAGGAVVLGALADAEHAPIEQGISRQAEASAKGMRPDGPLMSTRLPADGHAEGSLTLEPGACYTILGFGGAGVFDYQLHVVTSPPMPPQLLAQSTPGGVTPVVGAGEQCLRNPIPLPLVVKVDLHVVRGHGLVGAQVYRR
jgi:hypothetical protein